MTLTRTSRRWSIRGRKGLLAGLVAASLAFAGCGLGGGGGGGSDGQDGDPGPQGPPGPAGPPAPPPPGTSAIGPYDPLPGVVVTVTSATGGTAAGGKFQAGDTITVRYTVKTSGGTDLYVPDMDSGSIYLSGPTFNYQRVIASQSNLRAASVLEGGGVWRYTFTTPIPATYLAPYNDTPAFGPGDGELTGLALLSGTYTVGVQLYKYYTVEDVETRDAGVATFDVLFGSAVGIEPREVVTNANCNACHTDLRVHGGGRKDVRLCVLCHTSGAEDKSNPAVAGGTPGVSIDFRVMIHKIHDGAHLPSVLGVGVNADGSRNYGVTAQPYLIMGHQDSLNDFSGVSFPVWPNLSIAMPRDQGYTALATAERATEDTIRKGATACAKCHGGAAQGDLYKVQPSRRACGSCHDDINWSKPYTANGSTMPAQTHDGACAICHTASGGSLPVEESHRHPLLDPAVNPGLRVNVSALTEAGASNGNGKIDPGEKIQAQFTLTNDAGAAVDPAALASITAIVGGPTSNLNLLLNQSIPNTHPAFSSGVGSPPVYTMLLPQNVVTEWLGTSTASTTDAFTTVLKPHLNVTGSGTNTTSALTTVMYRFGADGPVATTTAASVAQQGWLDVGSVPVGLAANDYVVVDDLVPGTKEFAKVNTVLGTRIWLSSPLRYAHVFGSALREVPLVARTVTTQWTLDAANGIVTEVGDALGTANDVVCSYTTDFVMPAFYPAPYNDSPDFGEEIGEWKNLPLAAGTYQFNLYGYVNRVVALWGETQTYRGTAPGTLTRFLVGSATTIEPYALVSSGQQCYACHSDIWFHGGSRRGFETCISCHGTSGFEDRPSATAPPFIAASFRQMLHKVHMAEELPSADTYPWEAETGFPAMPGGVAQCVKCHGNDAWKTPTDRSHPTGTVASRNWGFVGGSCHDSAAAQAHIDTSTSGGVETCDACHGANKIEDVVKVHFPR